MIAPFYLDENFPLAVAEGLRRHGHFVTSVIAEGRVGASDAYQLLHAAERRWVIVTHNRNDFRLLHDAWLLWGHRWVNPQRHSGILILDQYQRQAASALVEAINALVADPAVSLGSALYDWKRVAGWVKFPG